MGRRDAATRAAEEDALNIQNRDAKIASTLDGLPSASTEAMLANPKFQQLVRQRSTLGWILAAIMVVVYFGLIALVAFDKPLVGQPVGAGPASLGIVLGVAVILTAVVLVGIYVAVANTRFDKMSDELTREVL